MDFGTTGQFLIIYFAFIKYSRKKMRLNETVHQLFINFKKAYDSFTMEVLYNILIKFGIPMKVVKLIKMCLNETPSTVHAQVNICLTCFLLRMV